MRLNPVVHPLKDALSSAVPIRKMVGDAEKVCQVEIVLKPAVLSDIEQVAASLMERGHSIEEAFDRARIIVRTEAARAAAEAQQQQEIP